MAKPRTIQIFLPDGNPRGVKIAEITNRTTQVMCIPRASFSFALTRPELRNVGVYFLVGESEDSGKPLVYIGETEDCSERLSNHNREKDFWQYALLVVSKTMFFTKSHVRYLEWHAIEQAKQAGRYELENGNERKKTHVSESVAADLLDNYDDIRTLVSALGYPIFDPVKQSIDKDILYCKGKGAVGKGEYTEDGMVVFKGSTCSLKETKGFRPALVNMRKRFIDSGILQEKDGFLVFTEDHTFNSPSTAADMVRANSSNGWTEWKYKNGKTLDEVKRQG